MYDIGIPEINLFKKNKASASSSNPLIRYETVPGEQGQFDWKESYGLSPNTIRIF